MQVSGCRGDACVAPAAAGRCRGWACCVLAPASGVSQTRLPRPGGSLRSSHRQRTQGSPFSADARPRAAPCFDSRSFFGVPRSCDHRVGEIILIVSVSHSDFRRYSGPMVTIQEQLGARVRDLRKKRGWTQKRLAAAAGRHWTYIGGIERGERNITVEVLGDIARALDQDIEELFRGVKTTRAKR